MSRALAAVRFALYAAVAAGVTRAPDVAGTVGYLAPATVVAAPSTLSNAGSETIGWLATATATALARTAGTAGLVFATVLAILATLALVEWRVRRVASPALAFAGAALVAACSLDVLHVGGDVASEFFFAALLVALDLTGTAGLIAVALVTALWCNASATGIVAPMFAVVYALGGIADRASKNERIRSQIAALVCALATLATPAFAAYPWLAWRALNLDNAVNDLLPSTPYVTAPVGYQIGAILTIVVALAVGARAARTGSTFVFALAAFLGFAKGACVPFFAIAGAPILAESAARLTAFPRRPDGPARPFAYVLAATIAPIAFAVAALSVKTLPTIASVASMPPFGVLAKFASLPEPRGRLLCTKLAWCDVAERQYGIEVVADTRVAMADDAAIQTQRDIAHASKDWQAKARAIGVEAIFIDAHSGFATLLQADGWTQYAADDTGVLFVRPGLQK